MRGMFRRATAALIAAGFIYGAEPAYPQVQGETSSSGPTFPYAAPANQFITGFSAAGVPAATQPSAPNLSDYAVGTWVPALSFGGAASGLTCSVCTGNYVKIGKRVVFDLVVALSAAGVSTGLAVISGLPFTSASGSSAGTIICPFYNAMSAATSIGGLISGSGTTITLYIPGAANPTGAANTNFTSTSQINCTGSYQTP